MKISIGSKIIEGPWGGGNQFAISLSGYLKEKGWEVTSSLSDEDIDIILMTEPRITSESGAYNQRQISKYLIRHPDALIVHRINECDERKGTRNVNKYLMRANRIADHTIFISNFLEDLFIEKGFFKNRRSSVVRNGADKDTFNSEGQEKWNGRSPLKLVTHHWGFDLRKGFDIYNELDKINSIDGIKIDFTYIGRIPNNIGFKKTRIIPPLSGKELSAELRKNHIYITGSMKEPAGMHHIEGAMCGLPLLYRDSGALPEYCNGFGVMFEGPLDFKEKLRKIVSEYDNYFRKLENYPYDSEKMCLEYEKVFKGLLKKGIRDIKKRRIRSFMIFLKETILYYKDISAIFLNKLKRKMLNAGKK